MKKNIKIKETKRIIKENKWNLLFFLATLVFIALMFFIEAKKNNVNENHLIIWQNIFIGFIACDVTIISIFFGAFIPMLVGNVKENVPSEYANEIKKKFFNIKKFSSVTLMLIIHFIQLMGCIYSFCYEPIIIVFAVITMLYFLRTFYSGYQIYKGFDYAYYFLKNLVSISKMIQKDIFKNKIKKSKKTKYNKKINLIINGFPKNEEQFNELGNLKLQLGIQLYYFIINLFSNGLFLHERFHFFKKSIYTVNIKYLKNNDEESHYEINVLEDIMLNRLVYFYSLFSEKELNYIFQNIRINNNIALFGNLSYYGMTFLTKLHLKLSSIKNWEIDNTWIIFFLNFVEKNKQLVVITKKEELRCHNKKNAKKFVKQNIYVNPGLFLNYCNICNDKKVLKKQFSNDAFQTLHTYTAAQSLFAIAKFSMENKNNILSMLSLDTYKNYKFIFNKNVAGLIFELDELEKYVQKNEQMKKYNEMFWIKYLKKTLDKSKIKITEDDIKNIEFQKYDEISDFLLEDVTLGILNSSELIKGGLLKIWTTKIYSYILKEIEEKNNEFQLYNSSKRISFPRPLLNLLTNLLRVQLAVYSINSKDYKDIVNIILDMKTYSFLTIFNYFDDKLSQWINQKFNLIKKTNNDSFSGFRKEKWFNLTLLNTKDDIMEEKEKWLKNLKKSE